MKNPFKRLTKLELLLYIISVTIVTVAFLIPEKKDYLNLICHSRLEPTSIGNQISGYFNSLIIALRQ